MCTPDKVSIYYYYFFIVTEQARIIFFFTYEVLSTQKRAQPYYTSSNLWQHLTCANIFVYLPLFEKLRHSMRYPWATLGYKIPGSFIWNKNTKRQNTTVRTLSRESFNNLSSVR